MTKPTKNKSVAFVELTGPHNPRDPDPDGRDCTSCGACCTFAGVPPFRPGETTVLPEPLKTEVREALQEKFRRQRDETWEEHPCMWWDVETKLCQHYEHRPNECRVFGPWGVTRSLCVQYRRFLLPRIARGDFQKARTPV